MRVYQEQHYEDVAELLHGYRPLPQVPIEVLIEAFANLFAADNPICCAHCGDEKGTTSICTRPNEGHAFEGGFDRKRFLGACGLEPLPA